jgi:hypothetical protein
MAVNYDDKRLVAVRDEKTAKIDEINGMYNDMVSESDEYYQKQIKASEDWEATQRKNQQAQTDFAIEKIEQQKEQAQKDYTKEQSGAYVDWQKESNRYGANAEEMASAGLINTGYGESSQVRMYNTYQNRVATARASFELAKQNYDNAITEARLQNDSILAEIAYKAYQQQLELSLQGFQYKNDLLREQASKTQEISDTYHARYQDVLAQINQEEAARVQAEQFEAQLRQQKEIQDAQLAEEKRQFDILNPPNNSYSFGSGSGNAKYYNYSGSGTVSNPLNSPLTDDKRKAMLASALGTKQAATQARQTTAEIASKTQQQKLANAEKKMHSETPQKYEFGTPYFRGEYNKDIKRYGAMSNGYQPKGISGYGAVSKTGKTEEVITKIQYGKDAGKTVKVVQNVWKTVDGTEWIWNGVANAYQKY